MTVHEDLERVLDEGRSETLRPYVLTGPGSEVHRDCGPLAHPLGVAVGPRPGPLDFAVPLVDPDVESLCSPAGVDALVEAGRRP